MSESEKAATIYKLKQEYEDACKERDILREALLQIADGYGALADQIRNEISFQTWDEGSLHATATSLIEKSHAYTEMLVKVSDLRARLEPHKDLFKPL